MHVLLDTHVCYGGLPTIRLYRGLLARWRETKNVIFGSAASAWEIATKVRLGKLPSAADLAADFAGHLERESMKTLPITVEHAIRAVLLPGAHKDPFERMLVAQSQAENIPLISNEVAFDSYGVRRIW